MVLRERGNGVLRGERLRKFKYDGNELWIGWGILTFKKELFNWRELVVVDMSV